jgi:hypothetical protein
VDSESKAHERFIRFLRTSQRILIFTGAGVSTGSGIPDFGGPQGVWTRRQPVYYDDFMQSEEARIEHWDYKLEGWSAFREARPNAVHEAIVDFERTAKLLLLVTQNITRVFVAYGLSGARRPRQITDQRLGTFEGVAQLRQVGDDRIGQRAFDLFGCDPVVSDQEGNIRQVLGIVSAHHLGQDQIESGRPE